MAVGVTAFGGPEALRPLELADPVPTEGQARVRLAAAAVSPTDALVRSGVIVAEGSDGPHVPGMDFAGVVDLAGPGSRWAVGDRVMGMALPAGPHGGAYVELIVSPDDGLTAVPDGLELAEASTIPMNGVTALQALDQLDLRSGDTLAVTGGAGVLAGYLMNIAQDRGLRVVADAAPEETALVRSLGADLVVVRGPGFASAVRAVVPDGVGGLADTAVLRGDATGAVRDGGAFVSFRGWLGDGDSRLRYFATSVSADYGEAGPLAELGRLAGAGVLVPRVAGILPASDAAEAHRRLDAGGTRGRLVLSF